MTDPAARLPFLIFSPVPVSGGQVVGWWGGPGGAGATIGCHQGSLVGEVTLRRLGGSLGSGEAHAGTVSHCVLTWRRAGTD